MTKTVRLSKRAVCGLLALLLLLTMTACGGASTAPSKPEIEENTDRNKDLYPYVVHTASATWYLAADDIALLGEDAYYEGLYALLENQEQDFADARAALAGYIPEEIPVIDIYTDFCGNAAISETAGAYYNEVSNLIKLFSGWNMAGYALLHEYVHYLTMHCAEQPSTHGFYAEGIAEYVSNIACKNRMRQSAAAESNMSEDDIAFIKSHGAWNEVENCVDWEKYCFGYAGFMAMGGMDGEEFFSTSDVMETRTAEMHEDPKPAHVSHFEAAAMLAYLMEMYSKDTVLQNLSTDPENMEAVYGASFAELYQSWLAWNMEKCTALGVQ